MDVERKLEMMDFSKMSKVRDSLKNKLLGEYRNELSMDELDLVAAAGPGHELKKDAELSFPPPRKGRLS